jgi:hypothetical protein
MADQPEVSQPALTERTDLLDAVMTGAATLRATAEQADASSASAEATDIGLEGPVGEADAREIETQQDRVASPTKKPSRRPRGSGKGKRKRKDQGITDDAAP